MNWLKAILAMILIAGMLFGAQQLVQDVHERYHQSPGDPAIQTQMVGLWLSMATGKQQAEVLEQTTPALAAATDPKHRLDIQFVRARAGILLPGAATDRAPALVEEFVKAAPQDDRSAELIWRLARVQPDQARQTPIYQRAADTYPTSYWGIMSKGALTQMANIGKPFELEFNDASTGRPVSIQRDLKGKVVVVYFWATWCSDCAAELPQMKQLYSAYRDKGVEFVGVSLDDPEAAGGLTKLKGYVARNSISWPNYFQGGERHRSEFSSKWGVSSTPTVFVLDKQGRLHSTAAKGQLETMIPALLGAS